jgi:hypothetical protein
VLRIELGFTLETTGSAGLYGLDLGLERVFEPGLGLVDGIGGVRLGAKITAQPTGWR